MTDFAQSWWWINWIRRGRPAAEKWNEPRTGESTTLMEWELAVARLVGLARIDASRLNRDSEIGSVRALCRPFKDRAPDEEWRRCARLSRMAGALLRSGGVECLTGSLGAQPDKPEEGAAQALDASRTYCFPEWWEQLPDEAPPARNEVWADHRRAADLLERRRREANAEELLGQLLTELTARIHLVSFLARELAAWLEGTGVEAEQR